MNIIKKNIFHILFFVVGFLLVLCAIKLHTFVTAYEEKSIRTVILVDTSSTITKVKHNTFYNTSGYFVDILTGNKFQAPIQDKIYREFEFGGNKPINMTKEFSQSEINNSGRAFLFLILSILSFIVGFVFICCVSYSKFIEYKEKFMFFLKYGNQNQ